MALTTVETFKVATARFAASRFPSEPLCDDSFYLASYGSRMYAHPCPDARPPYLESRATTISEGRVVVHYDEDGTFEHYETIAPITRVDYYAAAGDERGESTGYCSGEPTERVDSRKGYGLASLFDGRDPRRFPRPEPSPEASPTSPTPPSGH